MYDFIKDHHPFPDTEVLRNIVTGVEVGDHVDVYRAQTIGEKIIESMIGKNVLKHKYKRSMAAKTMNTVVISRGKDKLRVDPNEMFFHLITSGRYSET